MKWTQLIAGGAVGFASAYIIQKRKSSISSSEALTIVKSAFKQNGAIDGSWIETTTKVIQKHGLSFMVIQVELSEHVMQNRNITSFSLIKKRCYY